MVLGLLHAQDPLQNQFVKLVWSTKALAAPMQSRTCSVDLRGQVGIGMQLDLHQVRFTSVTNFILFALCWPQSRLSCVHTSNIRYFPSNRKTDGPYWTHSDSTTSCIAFTRVGHHNSWWCNWRTRDLFILKKGFQFKGRGHFNFLSTSRKASQRNLENWWILVCGTF